VECADTLLLKNSVMRSVEASRIEDKPGAEHSANEECREQEVCEINNERQPILLLSSGRGERPEFEGSECGATDGGHAGRHDRLC